MISGACWNSANKQIKHSEYEISNIKKFSYSIYIVVFFRTSMLNKMPPIYVYGSKISEKDHKSSVTCLPAYMTQLRQSYVIDINLALNKNQDEVSMPFLMFDSGEEEDQSKRLQRPVMHHIMSTLQKSISTINDTVTPSLSAAGASMRQTLSHSNQTLQQIKEANDEVLRSPESQLSYKPMTPNAPALPSNLQMARSKPTNQ